MEIDKKDLKVISYDFRVLAKRILNTNFEDFNKNLQKFINYIDSNELISNYIKSTIDQSLDVAEEIGQIQATFGRAIFDVGSNEREEISNVYQILKYISDNKVNIFQVSFMQAYCPSSNKYQDFIEEFNSRVTYLLIANIESYLTRISINMRYDEEATYMISNESGNVQVNISHDSSTINSKQEININYNQLMSLANDIEKLLDEKLEITIKEEIQANIDCLKEIAVEKKEKKSLLVVCKNALYSIVPKIKGSVELTAAIMAIIDFITTYVK